ncbi:MAG: hypothetical protein JO040_08300, partial [Gemmatimonadetes bacterium]|nr:hypothetical protein [Gemmatimonadota bacterium]
KWTCWGVALFPASVLYSAITVREAWIVLCLVYGALCAVRWHRGRGWGWFAAATAVFLFGSGLNSGLLAAAAVVSLEALVYGARALPVGRAARAALLAAGAFLIALAAANLAYRWGGENLIWLVRPAAFDHSQHAFSAGRTAYLGELHVRSVWDLFWQTPVRCVVFLFGFPWRGFRAGDSLAVLDALCYLALAVLVVRRAGVLLRDRAARGVLGIAVAVTLLIATFTGNYGTAFRHRAKVAPLLIALAAAGSLPAGRRRIEER